MFKWLTTTKKGFTIVELMIVMALLGLGAVALVSLIGAAYRSFDKSEERYAKQEQVRSVAEILQHSKNVGSANSATIFDSLDVLPTEGNKDKGYSYLYAVPVDAEGNEDNGEGGYVAAEDCVGYRLYVLNKGINRENAHCINPEIPLYIAIKVYKTNTTLLKASTTVAEGGTTEEAKIVKENSCAVSINISAMESDSSFETLDAAESATASGFYEPEDPDEIYYTLDVYYHFPNMATAKNDIVVNACSGQYETDADGNYIKDENGLPKRIFDTATVGNASVACADTGCVLRLVVDEIITGDNTETETTVPSFCFIATASYGYDSSEVGQLCEFRDKCLMTNPLGKLFVKTYYTLSPPIADFIRGNDTLKAAVRVGLKPLIVVAQYALEPQLFVTGLPWFALYGISVGGVFMCLHKAKKRRISKRHEAAAE